MAVREYTGLWWQPENPDLKIAGTLRIRGASKVELTLVGSFRRLDAQDAFQIPLIVGVGEAMAATLVGCFESGSKISGPGTAITRFQPGLTLLGAHVPRLEDLVFEKLYARFTHLERWANRSGLRQADQLDDAGQLKGFSVSYAYPDEVEAALPSAKVAVVDGGSRGGDRWDGYTMGHRTSVRIVPAKPFSLSELESGLLHHIQNLISLGTGLPVELTELSGTLAKPEDRPSHERRVEILSKTRRVKRAKKPRHHWEMLFTLDDLADDFSGHLSRWLDRANVLAPIFNLYFGTLFGPNMYGEHRFLSLAQAAESYHRRTSPTTILSKSLFRQVRRKLCRALADAGLPPEPTEQLGQKLSFLNEVPLKQRLRELLAGQGDLASLVAPETDKFVTLVSDTRNYLTHFDPRLKDKAATGAALYRVTEQLRYVIELILLGELGLSPERRRRIMRRHQQTLEQMQLLPSLATLVGSRQVNRESNPY